MKRKWTRASCAPTTIGAGANALGAFIRSIESSESSRQACIEGKFRMSIASVETSVLASANASLPSNAPCSRKSLVISDALRSTHGNVTEAPSSFSRPARIVSGSANTVTAIAPASLTASARESSRQRCR